jgi:hypothetical protein
VFIDVDDEEDDEETDVEEESANPDELVGQFLQFLDQVKPEDFSP